MKIAQTKVNVILLNQVFCSSTEKVFVGSTIDCWSFSYLWIVFQDTLNAWAIGCCTGTGTLVFTVHTWIRMGWHLSGYAATYCYRKTLPKKGLMTQGLSDKGVCRLLWTPKMHVEMTPFLASSLRRMCRWKVKTKNWGESLWWDQHEKLFFYFFLPTRKPDCSLRVDNWLLAPQQSGQSRGFYAGYEGFWVEIGGINIYFKVRQLTLLLCV